MKKEMFWWIKLVVGGIISVVLAPVVVWVVGVVWKLYKLFFAAVFPHAMWPNGDPSAGGLSTVALVVSGLAVLLVLMLIEEKAEVKGRDDFLTGKYCEICKLDIKKDESSFHFLQDGKQFDYCEKCRSKVYYTAGENVKSVA